MARHWPATPAYRLHRSLACTLTLTLTLALALTLTLTLTLTLALALATQADRHGRGHGCSSHRVTRQRRQSTAPGWC